MGDLTPPITGAANGIKKGRSFHKLASFQRGQGPPEIVTYHQLHKQLLNEHDRQVAALSDEVVRLRGLLEEAGCNIPVFESQQARGGDPMMLSAHSRSSGSLGGQAHFDDRLERMGTRGSFGVRMSGDQVSPSSGLVSSPSLASPRTIHFMPQGILTVNGDSGRFRPDSIEEHRSSPRCSVTSRQNKEPFSLWPEWVHEEGSMRRDRSFSGQFFRRQKVRTFGKSRSREKLTESKSEWERVSQRLFGLELPLAPGCRSRVIWDVLGLLMLLFDIIWIPLQVFDIEHTFFIEAIGWIALCFWTFDMPLSFLTGYIKRDGKVEYKYRRIAKRYLQTWFPLDIIIVGADWLSTILDLTQGAASDNSVGLARMGKIMRVARILRSLRLLRLAKLRQLLYVIEERIQSEYISILGGLVQQIAGLLALNHLIACLWWLVGQEGGEPNWIEMKGLDGPNRDPEVTVLLQYLVSLHWSWTQFTPASMEVYPWSTLERGFNVVVIVFAMVVFSSFVSSITSAMTRLRTLKSGEVTQTYLLKRYLRENSISVDLSSRVTRYIDLVLEVHKRRTDRSKVHLLNLLSGPLNLELQREVNGPYLCMHHFFAEYAQASPSAMGHLCFSCVAKLALSKGDTLFHFGADSNQMIFLVTGTLYYRRAKGVKRAKKIVVVNSGAMFCEAALWVPWVHRGTMKACIESDLAALDSSKFREVTTQHPDVLMQAIKYAVSFKHSMEGILGLRGHVWDLDDNLMYPEENGVVCPLPQMSESAMCEITRAEQLEINLMIDTESSSSEDEGDLSEEEEDDESHSPFGSPTPTYRRPPTPVLSEIDGKQMLKVSTSV